MSRIHFFAISIFTLIAMIAVKSISLSEKFEPDDVVLITNQPPSLPQHGMEEIMSLKTSTPTKPINTSTHPKKAENKIEPLDLEGFDDPTDTTLKSQRQLIVESWDAKNRYPEPTDSNYDTLGNAPFTEEIDLENPETDCVENCANTSTQWTLASGEHATAINQAELDAAYLKRYDADNKNPPSSLPAADIGTPPPTEDGAWIYPTE